MNGKEILLDSTGQTIVTKLQDITGALQNATAIAGPAGKDGEPGLNGADGKAATITVGKVETGAPLSITNSGTENDAIFDFVIPSGGGGGSLDYLHEENGYELLGSGLLIQWGSGWGDKTFIKPFKKVFYAGAVYTDTATIDINARPSGWQSSANDYRIAISNLTNTGMVVKVKYQPSIEGHEDWPCNVRWLAIGI